MAIRWTPWFNVPMHRRLEVLSFVFFFFIVLVCPLICVVLIIYSLIAGNIYWRIITVLYLIYLLFDINAAERGGWGSGFRWLRSFCVWKHLMNYFPIDLVKTADLPPNQNYLICIFPHGILSFGAASNFCLNFSKWSTLFPGIRPRLSTLPSNFRFPFARELQLSMGNISASAKGLTSVLSQSNNPAHKSNRDGCTSNGVGLIAGGIREQNLTYPNTYKFVVLRRRGFVRIAMQTGSALVPAISFGENNIYKVIGSKPGRRLFCGRGFLQYNFGLIPNRCPIVTVIGAPIYVEKIDKPSDDQLNEVHEIFCTKLKELFERYKSEYVENSEEVELELI